MGAAALLVAVGMPLAAAADGSDAAVAVFADGEVIRGQATSLADPSKAAVAKRPLFAAGNAVRWVRIGSADPADPEAFVEFDNGDRLPGRVVVHEPEGFEWTTLPGAVLAEPLTAQPMNHPVSRPAVLGVSGSGDAGVGATPASKAAAAGTGTMWVQRDRVRRVVWRRHAVPRHPPGTLVLADGGVIAFRSLRWTDAGVIVLLEDGSTERHGFDAIAALHLPPRPDSWNAWFESLVDDSGVVQAALGDGTRVTTPRSRWRPAHDTPAAMIVTQPSWSLGPLNLAVAAVSSIAVFDVGEAPLSAIAPLDVVQRSTFGQSWTWRIDRNVLGGPLDVAGPPAGWGFGVQARTELTVPLCDGVRAFRGRVALDRAAGDGGCVRASLHAQDAGSPALWASDVLVGSDTVADCGTVALGGPAKGQTSLVLVVDDAHRDRPAAADPFDVRDIVDWCDPLLVLDPARVKQQVAARLPFVIPAWAGWTAAPADGDAVRIVSEIDPILDPRRAGWSAATVVDGGPLRLARAWPVLPPQATHLVIAASVVGTKPGAIEVRVDGWRWRLPLPQRSDRMPAAAFVLPVAGRPDGPLAVEIVVPRGIAVLWHALGLTGDLETKWFPLEPVTLESSAGSTFTRRDDGGIVVGPPAPQQDDYTLRLASKQGRIRALRIDALTDRSLPEPFFGPGRTADGFFRMTGISLAAEAGGGERVIPIVKAYSDPVSSPAGPMAAVRQRPGRWWQGSRAGPTTAVFQLEQVEGEAPEAVVVRMEFDATHKRQSSDPLGCFRVYGSTDPAARLPLPRVTWLVRQPEPDSAAGRTTIVGVPAEPGGAP